MEPGGRSPESPWEPSSGLRPWGGDCGTLGGGSANHETSSGRAGSLAPPSGDWSRGAVPQSAVLTSQDVYRSVCSLCVVWGSCQCKCSNDQGFVKQDRQEGDGQGGLTGTIWSLVDEKETGQGDTLGPGLSQRIGSFVIKLPQVAAQGGQRDPMTQALHAGKPGASSPATPDTNARTITVFPLRLLGVSRLLPATDNVF